MQWLMLQQNKAEDFVISTGRMETVRSFIELCARKLNWNKTPRKRAIIWEGEGVNEIGRRSDTNEIVIRVDPRYFRPTEVDELVGDSTKARLKLGWSPKISLEELVEEMINEDIKLAQKELNLIDKGFKVSRKYE